jgi:hypothetical protein
MSTHYAATGTRTLCGRTLGPRLKSAPLWADFLLEYRERPGECCAACLRACKGWQRFSRDLAMVREEQRKAAGRTG